MNLPAEYTKWLNAMVVVARHYGISVSEESVRVDLSWHRGAATDSLLENMARQLGLTLRLGDYSKDLLDPWRLPLVAELNDGQVAVVKTADGNGQLSLLFGEDQGLETSVTADDLQARIKRVLLLRPRVSMPDSRVDDYIKPYRPSWFWLIALRDWRRYGDVITASLFANVLALATMMFSMQIYDRVIPAQSESTLWVLFGGVMLAIGFEFALRMARTYISDLLGKRADLKISDVVFGHALRLRNDARSKSTGSFIAQIRELDQVRDLLTSSTMSVVADLPFFLLFTVVLWLVGGPLVLVAVAAVPLLVIPGLLIQRPLAKLSTEGMRESALRSAMLVEAVQGIEDIKLMRAESRFQNQWNHVNEVSAGIGMRQRYLVGLLMTWTQEVQSIVYALVLLVGSYLVIQGEMTTGALVGSSILASRMIAPLAQLSGVFARWQQAKVARKGLDDLMQRPVDQPENTRLIHRPVVHGEYVLEGALFQYGRDDRHPALALGALQIRVGEKIAVLGRMGAGKSTLLQVLAGLQVPQQGTIKLDGIELGLIDPADVRRDVGLLTQNARLFHGSIRDNITLGMPLASDDEIFKVLDMVGALGFVQACTHGLDELIPEGGQSLSGGQRQALLLARTLIREPAVVLLDEPTSSLDEMTERQVIANLSAWLAPRTVVVATHRTPVLNWADRILVLNEGRLVVDGPKAQVLKELSK